MVGLWVHCNSGLGQDYIYYLAPIHPNLKDSGVIKFLGVNVILDPWSMILKMLKYFPVYNLLSKWS